MDYFSTSSGNLLKRPRPGDFPGRLSEDLASEWSTYRKGEAFVIYFGLLEGLSSRVAFT